MSQPGWYPDPTGDPDQFRYWDGAAWSETTRTAGAPPSGQKPSRRTPVMLAVLILAIIALVIWRGADPRGLGAGPVDTNSSTPSISAWDETAHPSSSRPVVCPDPGWGAGGTTSAGRMHSGGLSVPLIPGWDQPTAFFLSGVTDAIAQFSRVTTSWRADSAVGTVLKSTFATPRQAAVALAECFVTADNYPGFSGRKTVLSEEFTVSGHSGYHVRAEVRVTGQEGGITGDVIDLIAVDTGDSSSLGIYLGAAPIGRSAIQRQVDAVIADIRVT